MLLFSAIEQAGSGARGQVDLALIQKQPVKIFPLTALQILRKAYWKRQDY